VGETPSFPNITEQSCNTHINYLYPDRLERILTLVYVVQNSQNFSGLFPSSCIPKNTTFRKLDLFPKRRVFFGIQEDGKSPEKFCAQIIFQLLIITQTV
jgi:hypothetical protein